MENKICPICMNSFSKPTICCSKECSKERSNILSRWAQKRRRSNTKAMAEKTKPEKKKTKKDKKPQSILEINNMALASGMSYGKYVAINEGGMRCTTTWMH